MADYEIDSIILNGTEYAIVGSGGGTVILYSITNNLTNVVSSNGASSIREGRSYSAVLSVVEGASLDSVTIKMGGMDITSTAWNSGTMTISIASVTNDVVITAKASISIEQSITWGGTGTDLTTNTFDATNYDAYLEIPFVSGDTRLNSNTTAASNAIKIKAILYYDAERTQFAGRFFIDTQEIAQQDRTMANSPALTFNNRVKIAPAGYYVYLYAANNCSAFNSNSNARSYMNEFATKVYLVTPDDDDGDDDEPTLLNAQVVDRDLLQNYSLNALSLTTDTIDDATTYEGVLEAAKNEWMLEYGGSMNKIPLIIHTDQHDTMSGETASKMWETIDNMISWFDVSKCINLGDTTNSYENYDNPLQGDANLEAYLEATEHIPFSKRIEVFGNHDCMKIISGSLTYIKQYPSYLNPYFKNVMARRTSDNGFHVTYDPYFNVKYIVYSKYDYVDSTHYELVSTEQYDFLIDEMSKNDGYDIILCGHTHADIWQEYVGTLAQARYNKTSGNFIDKMGVTHTYNFTGCENDLLVCLHGHDHNDGYNYNIDVLSQSFANYYDGTRPIFFAIVDRINRQLKVWKVTNTPAYTTYTRPFDEPEEVIT